VYLTQRSYVDGDIQLENGRNGGNARILASTIDGNLQVKQNRVRLVIRGGVVIHNNRIAENLQYKQNNPAQPAATTGPGTRKVSAPGYREPSVAGFQYRRGAAAPIWSGRVLPPLAGDALQLGELPTGHLPAQGTGVLAGLASVLGSGDGQHSLARHQPVERDL
jgi:hypothetical protein